MSLWDSITSGAKKAGDAAAVQAMKGKLRADILLLDREMAARKRAFGVTMYDQVSPLTQSADFYAASDDLTNMLKPPLIRAQREIQALAGKRVKLMEALAAAEANRAAAFPTKAETVGQRLTNFGRASVLHGGETKIKAELAIVDMTIKGFKQGFGVELFDLLAEAEDQRGYLPTDRAVRNMYDTCRGDIQRLQDKRNEKGEEIVALGGTAPPLAGSSTKDPAEPAMHISERSSSVHTENMFQPPNGDSFSPHASTPTRFSAYPPATGAASSSGYSNPSYTPSSYTGSGYSDTAPRNDNGWATTQSKGHRGEDLLLDL
jgi:hypothetical protein